MNSIIYKPKTCKFHVYVDLQDESNYPCGQYDTLDEAKKQYIESEKVLNWRKDKDMPEPKIIYLKPKEDKISALETRISALERKLKNGKNHRPKTRRK